MNSTHIPSPCCTSKLILSGDGWISPTALAHSCVRVVRNLRSVRASSTLTRPDPDPDFLTELF